MFLTFQKVTTSSSNNSSAILVNSRAIMLIEPAQLEDKTLGITQTVTRVEIGDFIPYRFYTQTPYDTVISSISSVDLTAGSGTTGTQCNGDAGILNILTPTISYPLIQALAISNNSSTETRSFTFNPEFLVYAEEALYKNSSETGLMLTLRENPPKQILAKLALQDLIDILEPIQIT